MATFMTRSLPRAMALATRRCASTSNVSRMRGTPHLKRKLGQHLLVSDGVLDAIVAAAELPTLAATRGAEPLRVLEIGPGTGNLTSALLRAHPSVQVQAVEFDGRMVEQLQQRFESELAACDGHAPRLQLQHADFEAFRFDSAGTHGVAAAAQLDACVANIPYQLSSLVVSRLSSYMQRFPRRFRCAVLLVQEEFALRLLAQPGDQNYSRLSANTALVCDVASVVPVPRTHFLPPPKVDSRVIKLTPRVAPLPTLPRDEDALFFRRFDALLRLCFQRKNKTLRALLLAKTARAQYELADELVAASDVKQAVTERVEAALAACALSSSRAVKIPVTDFMALLRALQDRGLDVRPSSTRHFQD